MDNNMICSVDVALQLFISVLKKASPESDQPQEFTEQLFCFFFLCFQFSGLCPRRALIDLSECRDTQQIMDSSYSVEIMALLCVSSCCCRSCFPSAANEEFNGSVGGHVRFIDAVVSWKCSCCVFILLRPPLAVVHYSEPCVDGQLCALVGFYERTIPSAHIGVFTSVLSELYGSELICVHQLSQCVTENVPALLFYGSDFLRDISFTH